MFTLFQYFRVYLCSPKSSKYKLWIVYSCPFILHLFSTNLHKQNSTSQSCLLQEECHLSISLLLLHILHFCDSPGFKISMSQFCIFAVLAETLPSSYCSKLSSCILNEKWSFLFNTVVPALLFSSPLCGSSHLTFSSNFGQAVASDKLQSSRFISSVNTSCCLPRCSCISRSSITTGTLGGGNTTNKGTSLVNRGKSHC